MTSLSEKNLRIIGFCDPWGAQYARGSFYANGNLKMFLTVYCKALFFRGGLIFAYFAENENSAKIKPAKIKIGKSHCRSVGAVCMHSYWTTLTKFV